jgi:predicted dehydrogenase
MHPRFTRRTFLKTSALGLAGAALSARSWAQVAGASSDIRVAVLGLNGRGGNHLSSLRALPGVRIVAICDPDTAVLERTAARLARDGLAPEKFTDVRKLLARPDLDAVTIATPNHWHSLAGIWACQAGKDVYVEKPVSHNVWEGRQLAAAAAKHHRVVQAGTQIRSGEGMQEAVAWVRAGSLGRITAARGFCYKRRDSIGRTTGPQPVPSTVDYDLWSGPAPLAPPQRNSPKNGPVHYEWHWIWAYGNGDIGNQGIHQMDVARWFLGEPGLPRHTLSIGGRLGYEDDGQTPNTQVIIHDYATAPLIFEVRGLPARAGAGSAVDTSAMNSAAAAGAAAGSMDKYRGVSIGNVIDCEGGSVVTGSYFAAQAFDRDGKLIREFKGRDRHMENFIEVVRSRRTADLYGSIEEGHISSALCHLGNISHQLGQAGPEDRLLERIQGDAPLVEAVGRMREHLAANRVDPVRTPLTRGLPLAFDSATEKFTGPDSAAANALLTRDYRAPFVVPQIALAGSCSGAASVVSRKYPSFVGRALRPTSCTLSGINPDLQPTGFAKLFPGHHTRACIQSPVLVPPLRNVGGLYVLTQPGQALCRRGLSPLAYCPGCFLDSVCHMKTFTRLPCLLLTGLLAACSSPPTRTYTITVPDEPEEPALPVDVSGLELLRPTRPIIPDRTFRLTDFGGAGDGVTMNTSIFEHAIAAVAQAGGGRLVVPPGVYRTAPFILCSNLELHLEEGAVIQAPDNFAALGLPDPATFRTQAEADARYRVPAPLISGKNLHDVALTGPGTIDGNGAHWWAWSERAARNAARTRPGRIVYRRPHLVVINGCERLLVADLTFTNSPMFHLVPSNITDLTIERVKVRAPWDGSAPNTDAIDPGPVTRAWIHHCDIDTGDDNIVIKTGGTDILIEDNIIRHGHGISIGSGTTAGVNRMLVRRCTFEDTDNGIRIKSMRGAGGLVQNVRYTGITMKNVAHPIVLQLDYVDNNRPGFTGDPTRIPAIRHILIDHVTIEGARIAGIIHGLPDSPITHVTLQDVTIIAEKDFDVKDAADPVFENVNLDIRPGVAPPRIPGER